MKRIDRAKRVWNDKPFDATLGECVRAILTDQGLDPDEEMPEAKPAVTTASKDDTRCVPAWYCPKCKVALIWKEVTYEERHDPRAGGCGFAVDPIADAPVPVPAPDPTLRAEALRLLEEHIKARQYTRTMLRLAEQQDNTTDEIRAIETQHTMQAALVPIVSLLARLCGATEEQVREVTR